MWAELAAAAASAYSASQKKHGAGAMPMPGDQPVFNIGGFNVPEYYPNPPGSPMGVAGWDLDDPQTAAFTAAGVLIAGALILAAVKKK